MPVCGHTTHNRWTSSIPVTLTKRYAQPTPLAMTDCKNKLKVMLYQIHLPTALLSSACTGLRRAMRAVILKRAIRLEKLSKKSGSQKSPKVLQIKSAEIHLHIL